MMAIMAAISVAFAVTMGNLGRIMLFGNVKASSANTGKTITVTIPRGTVYDRKMVPLTNAAQRTLAVVPPTAEAVSAVSSQLDSASAKAALERLKAGNPVLIEVPHNFKCEDAEIFSVAIRYSHDQLAAHVLGYLNGEGTGITGIEKAYDELLSACEPLEVTYTVDAVGRPLSGVEPQISGDAQSDNGIILTLDSRIQRIVESVAGEKIEKGAVVVMESSTGKLLASCSLPSYSPLDLTGALESDSALVDRTLATYNVGSVFKLCVAAAALKNDILTFKTANCTGNITIGENIFNCHLLTGHGRLDMTTALAQSCNCYFIELGRAVGANKIYDMCVRLGFNRAYQLAEGMSAMSGILPDLTKLNEQPAALANFSFGQGDLMLTPLHVATMVAAIANGGNHVTPSLVSGTISNGKVNLIKTPQTYRVMSEAQASALSQMMKEVMSTGTGKNSMPANSQGGGKTATAETGWVINSVAIKQSWFAGFYPDNGKYTIVVLRENGRSGAVDCAPVYKEIVDMLSELGLD